ncbi:hypothetical protein UFOVP1483_32 [uncultured Caudovirales phage]|uniref:Uncharacterized protein n=1 Tax=uncultured Caudovirales phage TaxID=2100421 RepID=A0A6J5SLK0_9CAUD|nr:hypothetical protein UFOVP1483_32 [uncultured Caudovirales phage]
MGANLNISIGATVEPLKKAIAGVITLMSNFASTMGSQGVAMKAQIDAAATEINASLAEATQSFEKFGGEGDKSAKKTVSSVTSLRMEIKKATADAFLLSREFGMDAAAAVKAQQKAANLKEEMSDLTQRIAAMNPEAKFKALGDAAKGVSGAFGAATGAMQLLGGESEATQAAMAKLQAIMAITEGLNSIQALPDAFKTLKLSVVQAMTAMGMFKMETVAVAEGEEALAVASQAAGLSMRGALIATGIGALIVGIGLLIANWDSLTEGMTGATKISKVFDEAQQEVTKNVADFDVKLLQVKSSLKLAEAGTISKQQALDDYNSKLGVSVGYAGDLKQAEDLLASNTSSVIESIKLKAQATIFYQKSAEALAKTVSGEGLEPGFWESSWNLIKSGGDVFKFATADANSYVDNLKDVKAQANAFAKAGDDLTKKALENEAKLKKGLPEKPKNAEEKKDDAAKNAAKIIEAEEKLYNFKKEIASREVSLMADGVKKDLANLSIKHDSEIRAAIKGKQDLKALKDIQQKEEFAVMAKGVTAELELLDSANELKKANQKKASDDFRAEVEKSMAENMVDYEGIRKIGSEYKSSMMVAATWTSAQGDEMKRLQYIIGAGKKALEDYAKQGIEPTDDRVKDIIKSLTAEEKALKKVEDKTIQGKKVADMMNQALSKLASEGFVQLGTALGNVISGKGGFDALFSGILGAVADFLVHIGEGLIATAIAVEAFKDMILENPVAAVAIGVVAIAAGVALKNYIAEGPSFAVGAMNVPFDMSANIHKGEMIIPKPFADDLRKGNGLGGGNMQVAGLIRGRDLAILAKKNGQSNLRVTGRTR